MVGRREVAASAAIERMDFIVGSVVLGGCSVFIRLIDAGDGVVRCRRLEKLQFRPGCEAQRRMPDKGKP